jgi:Tfp pilus assembly protein PilX
MHLIHRCQQGFTTVTMMGVLMVGGLLVAASFAAVDPDIGLSKKDEDAKQAYAAAEAGLNYYLKRLGQDNSYYTKCDQVPSPTENAVNLEWNGSGADPRRWQKIPGFKAEYAIELLAVQTTAVGMEVCIPNQAVTMVNPSTGTFRIRSTGRVRTPTGATDKPYKRSLIATLRRESFIDYLWFTDFETQDPLVYEADEQAWAAANCAAYRAQRSSSCQDQNFISVDVLAGPFKTNDSISVCGDPTFGGDSDDSIQLNGASPGWVAGCGSANPNFQGTIKHPAGILPMPQSNAELAAAAGDTYTFDGETRIRLNGTTMDVTTYINPANPGLGLQTQTLPLPPEGVLYVKNTGCGTGYNRRQEYGNNLADFDSYMLSPGCGNAWVSGTFNSDVTIGADNDIIVVDDLTGSTSTKLGGLIANNFVRVYHPVTFGSGDNCTNSGGPGSIRIDAAILALNHSFVVDNYYCGNGLGTLTVNGAIAQKFRGTVGQHSGGTPIHGYAKDYNYNDELRFREPPHFVNPTESPWRIVRQNEQVPAR